MEYLSVDYLENSVRDKLELKNIDDKNVSLKDALRLRDKGYNVLLSSGHEVNLCRFFNVEGFLYYAEPSPLARDFNEEGGDLQYSDENESDDENNLMLGTGGNYYTVQDECHSAYYISHRYPVMKLILPSMTKTRQGNIIDSFHMLGRKTTSPFRKLFNVCPGIYDAFRFADLKSTDSHVSSATYKVLIYNENMVALNDGASYNYDFPLDSYYMITYLNLINSLSSCQSLVLVYNNINFNRYLDIFDDNSRRLNYAVMINILQTLDFYFPAVGPNPVREIEFSCLNDTEYEGGLDFRAMLIVYHCYKMIRRDLFWYLNMGGCNYSRDYTAKRVHKLFYHVRLTGHLNIKENILSIAKLFMHRDQFLLIVGQNVNLEWIEQTLATALAEAFDLFD